MERRINDVELDELDKLLDEIPNVTSGAPSQHKSSNNQHGFHGEGPNLPDDQSLVSAFSELSFKDTSSPLLYGRYPNDIHELSCNFDYLPSLGSSLGNNFMGVDPRFQFIQNVPNVQGVEFPLFPNQQHCYSQIQQLSTIEEDQFYQMPQQHFGMAPRLRSQQPYPADGNMTPRRLTSQNFQNHGTNLRISNQEALWNKANSVPSARLWNYGFQGEGLPKSLGVNSLKKNFFHNVNHKDRVFSNNNYKVSSDLYGDLKCTPPMLQSYNLIDEVEGRIYFMAKDQNGCRFLQRKITEGAQKDVRMIFSEIIMHVVELMTDPFGNYLVQKILEVCNEDQCMQILRSITQTPGDLVRISCDIHGTRAVQKIVENLKSPEQISLFISSLRPAIVTLMKNINANHVAQRCLQYLSPEYSEFIYEAAFSSCVELATDRHGCCVIQKCLSQCGGDKRHHLMCEITSNALILSQDQYGNYVVQFVLKTKASWAILDVLDQLEGNYGDLSMQKYSSNVIEKCLKYSKEEQQSCIIQELISDSRFDQILQDPYGNYVIQAALKRSKATLHGALVEAIRPYIPLLRTSPYGKKVLQAIA